MRKKIVIGNWKMNMTPSQAQELLKILVPKCKSEDVDVVFCPPYVDLYTALEETKGTNICIGAQNVHFEEKGAYTGEVSPSMLEDMGIKYVIIGHCERRKYFAESDEDVNKKAKKLLEHKIVPVICCGETLEQREADITLEVIKKQIKIALLGIEANLVENIIIAYEPIWAIGTGKVATKEQAQEVCLAIRETIKEVYNEKVSQNIRILYGGSVNKDNVASLFSQSDIDGGLVGGASLKEEFEVIVNLGR